METFDDDFNLPTIAILENGFIMGQANRFAQDDFLSLELGVFSAPEPVYKSHI